MKIILSSSALAVCAARAACHPSGYLPEELPTRWNTGVGELDRDLPGVQLSRIVDASFHSVNLVPCPAPVPVGVLPPELVSVDDFYAETFQDSRIAPRRPGPIDRYAPPGVPGLDAWDGDSLRSLDLQSKTLLCELLDRLGTSDFPQVSVAGPGAWNSQE